MTRKVFLVVLFCFFCIAMGLKPRGQAHELINGKLGPTISHELKNGQQQHKLIYQQYHQDDYEQQTTPDDVSSTTNDDNGMNNKPSKSLINTSNKQQHKIFGSYSQSTTNDGKGYHQHEIGMSQMSSYQHYYGQSHKILKNRQHSIGEGGLRDEYSMMMNDNGKNGQYQHNQNDLEEPNNGERTYYVDDDVLRQGLRQQDTSSVKVRDYVDYIKEVTPGSSGSSIPTSTGTTTTTTIIRHNLGDIDKSGSSVSHYDEKVFYQHDEKDKTVHQMATTPTQSQQTKMMETGKTVQEQHNLQHHGDEAENYNHQLIRQQQRQDESTTQSSSIQLHDPNDDQYIVSHKVQKQQIQQGAGMTGNMGVTGVDGNNGIDDNDNSNDNYDNNDDNINNQEEYHTVETTMTTTPQQKKTISTTTPMSRDKPSGTTSPSTTTTVTTSQTDDDNKEEQDNDDSNQHKWRNSQ